MNKYLKCSVWRLALRYDIYIYMSLGFKRLITSIHLQRVGIHTLTVLLLLLLLFVVVVVVVVEVAAVCLRSSSLSHRKPPVLTFKMQRLKNRHFVHRE